MLLALPYVLLFALINGSVEGATVAAYYKLWLDPGAWSPAAAGTDISAKSG